MHNETDLLRRLTATAEAAGLVVGRRYRHYRTRSVYEVVALALREDDQEPTVVYRNVSSGLTWTRPLDDFVRRVNAEDIDEPRFVRRFEPLDPWEYPEDHPHRTGPRQRRIESPDSCVFACV